MELWTLAFGTYFLPVAGLILLAILLSLTALGIAINKTVLARVDRLDRAVTALKNGDILEIEDAQETIPDQLARLRSNFNEMALAVRDHTAELERLVAERTRELEELVGRDPMTGARNRRSFYKEMQEERHRAQRFGGQWSVLMFDIDHFKKINDTFGHAAGDAVLQQVATVMNEELRDIDFLARYGGEEFALIAPQTDLSGAEALGEKLRRAVAEAAFSGPASSEELSATVSIGVAEYDGDAEATFHAADAALYEAKAAGKDCVIRA